MAETKVCDNCDAEIGVSETKCPKCGTELAELDEIASAVERGQAILDKRRKRNAPPAPPAPVETVRKGLARLRELGRPFVKK